MKMVWCDFCAKNCQTGLDHETLFVSCVECGKVVFQDSFTDNLEFELGAGGEKRVAGNCVRSIQSHYKESYIRTVEKGTKEIHDLAVRLIGYGNEGLERPAARFYRMAVERGFTRGRRTEHIAASCLYIACREKKEPYLLIDFSILLTVNVYVLGAVFLQLCKLLSLDLLTNHQMVDPSLFMHRFTNGLMEDGDYQYEVLQTALNIVASMKRDWMQTGRKPSGICGAALYISALSHGLNYSKSDILKLVHIGEATLTKRLFEFEGTTSSSLTIEELNQKAKEYEKKKHLNASIPIAPKGSGTTETLCEHTEKECFAHGLCKDCYEEFLDTSGGLDGEANPPAFAHVQMHRLSNTSPCQDTCSTANASGVCEATYTINGNGENPEMHYSGTFKKSTDDPDIIDDNSHSGIDEMEVDSYILTAKESLLKKTIFELTYKDFIEEQAAKQAAAASRSYGNNPDDEAEAKTRKEKRRKRALAAKNVGPPQTPLEAIKKMVVKKGFSSKVNMVELEKLMNESLA